MVTGVVTRDVGCQWRQRWPRVGADTGLRLRQRQGRETGMGAVVRFSFSSVRGRGWFEMEAWPRRAWRGVTSFACAYPVPMSAQDA